MSEEQTIYQEHREDPLAGGGEWRGLLLALVEHDAAAHGAPFIHCPAKACGAWHGRNPRELLAVVGEPPDPSPSRPEDRGAHDVCTQCRRAVVWDEKIKGGADWRHVDWPQDHAPIVAAVQPPPRPSEETALCSTVMSDGKPCGRPEDFVCMADGHPIHAVLPRPCGHHPYQSAVPSSPPSEPAPTGETPCATCGHAGDRHGPDEDGENEGCEVCDPWDRNENLHPYVPTGETAGQCS